MTGEVATRVISKVAPRSGFPPAGVVLRLARSRVIVQHPGDKIELPLAPVSDTRFVLIGAGANGSSFNDKEE